MQAQLSFGVKALVVAVLAAAFAFALPNVLSPTARAALPGFMPNQAMPLGLDLQGGAHLVLEVDLADVQAQAYDNLLDTVRLTLREARTAYTGLGVQSVDNAPAVVVTLTNPADTATLTDKLAPEGVMLTPGAGGSTIIQFNSNTQAAQQERALQQTLQVLRSRVDEFGVAEPVIQRLGNSRVIVELPGVRDVNRAKAAIGRTARLTFHLVDDNPGAVVRPDQLALTETSTGADGQTIQQRLIVTKRPALSGDMLTGASAAFDQFGAPAVDIAFDARGTRAFAQISTDNVGRRFAIVLDGTVYSAPVFREPILGGRAQISGSFTAAEAQDLAAILSAGALPAKVNVVEERTVGPSLGSDSVQAGVLALVVGFVLVLIFMVLFYGLFGLFANIALFVNLVLLVAVMSAVGFTLSLPGMAAMVLTLGMAVDANVLIYERMREEMAAGKKPLAAVLGGFNGAFSTIFDSNLTTLIAAVVLFALGSGPVKGFAVSLSIGLLASMFTAITLSRWLILTWLRYARPTQLPL
jgi:protein-export membrane protein SecD